jgi:hypothetical protein
VESSFRDIFNKQKEIHIHNFSSFYDQQKRVSSDTTSDSKKFILNLSKHIFTDSEEAVLVKGLNFLVIYPLSSLDMASVMESVVSQLPQTLRMEFRSMLQNSQSSRTNKIKMELKVVGSLKLNRDIRILQTKAMAPRCWMNLNTLLESGIYGVLPKDPTARVERKVQTFLSKYKTALPTVLKQTLTPYYSKPKHIYGLPKVHKPDIHQRHIVNFIGPPCYTLAGFLYKILISY